MPKKETKKTGTKKKVSRSLQTKNTTKKKAINKALRNEANTLKLAPKPTYKLSKTYKIVYQGIIGVIFGVILSLLLAWFYSGASQFAKAPFSMVFAYSMIFGVPLVSKLFLGAYPIGLLLGIYLFGKKMHLKGNFVMSLVGFVLYIIIFELTKNNIVSAGLFWTYVILLPLILIMLGYYFFVMIERKAL